MLMGTYILFQKSGRLIKSFIRGIVKHNKYIKHQFKVYVAFCCLKKLHNNFIWENYGLNGKTDNNKKNVNEWFQMENWHIWDPYLGHAKSIS